MQIQVRAQRIDVDPKLSELIERRLLYALGRFEHRIARVQVHLIDLNGPRSGLDKSCRLQIKLHYATEVLIECIDATVEAAVCEAADRAGSAVQRELDRRRDQRRWPMDRAAQALRDGEVV